MHISWAFIKTCMNLSFVSSGVASKVPLWWFKIPSFLYETIGIGGRRLGTTNAVHHNERKQIANN